MGLRDPDIGRLLAAFRIEKADRVPHWELSIEGRTLSYLMGREVPYLDYKGLLPSEREEYRLRTGQFYPEASSWFLAPPDLLGLCQTWPNEAMAPYCSYYGTAGAAERGSIRSWEDLEKLRPVIPVEDRMRYLQSYIDIARGTSVGVGATFFAPFTDTCENLGVDGLAYLLYDDPKLVTHLLDLYTRDARHVAEAVADLDIDFVYLADDIADNKGPFLQPRLMEELWLPRAAYILEPIHARHIPVAFHCCGNLTQIMPWLIQLGVSAVQPVQPNCNDIYALKKQYGDRMCFIGNIEVPGCLSFGTVDDVVRETKEHIDRLAYNGGYVCASSHSVTPAVKPENYVAMLETIIDYRAYR